MSDRVGNGLSKGGARQPVELMAVNAQNRHVEAEFVEDERRSPADLFWERAPELGPPVVVEAVVAVPEHLHIGLSDHQAGIGDQIQRAGDAQALAMAGSDQEGVVSQSLHEQVLLACDVPFPGCRELQRKVMVDLVCTRLSRGRLRSAHEPPSDEVGELAAHERVVGCAAAFHDLAVAQLGETVPGAIHADGRDHLGPPLLSRWIR